MNKSPIHNDKSLYPDLEPDQNPDESWQVSYLDIITIVLGFLIILLSVSQFTKSPMSSLSTLFGKKSDETEYITTPIEEIQKELEILLRDQIALGNVEIVRDLNDLRIRLKGDDFYASGSTRLQPKARTILEDVLVAFKEVNRSDFIIDVEGHTDNAPIRSARFPSNWELSTARASNVVKYFKENGINDKRLKASGYADSRPVIQYDSLGLPYAADRDMNRRVVLRLYYTADQLRAANRDSLTTDPNPITENDVINQQAERLSQMARNQPVDNGSVQRNTSTTPPEETTTQSPQTESTPQPEVVYIAPPTPLKSAPLQVPSFTDQGTQCRFAPQFATANNLSSAFRQARRVETTLGNDPDIWLSGEQFSIRTEPSSDLSSLLNDRPQGMNNIVHQCVNNGKEIPSKLRYQIQFGAFQNEANALDYVVQLFDTYSIQAYMNRSAENYNVITGPFSTREEVSSEISRYRSLGIQADMFIKYADQSPVSSGYLYQVLYARSSVESDLEPVLAQLNNAAEIVQYNDLYLLLSPQFLERSVAEQAIQNALSATSGLSPSLFLLEFY